MSIDDLKIRAKIGNSGAELLKQFGCLEGLPQSNQLSLFGWFMIFGKKKRVCLFKNKYNANIFNTKYNYIFNMYKHYWIFGYVDR